MESDSNQKLTENRQNNSVRNRVMQQIQHMADHAVIKNRRFLDDEQLVRSEQMSVLEEIFNDNVRDEEIRELSSHFSGILRGDPPVHLAIWGKCGTGKTLSTLFFLKMFSELCIQQDIPLKYIHLDLSTPRPCFRALNDLACLLNASKRYRKGISLEEMMQRIEEALANQAGYFVLFVDECDHVKRDSETFMTFLIRRLPQNISAKLIIVFASNRLDWPDQLDPRVKSFLKINELIFKPYDAIDLQKILRIRVEKALHQDKIVPGVIEKIAALSSRNHGDARQAVALLAKSAYIAEKTGTSITLDTINMAEEALESDRYLTLLKSAPKQLQLTLNAVKQAIATSKEGKTDSTQAYQTYETICTQEQIRPLSTRAFSDMLNELETYSFITTQIISRGRYGKRKLISTRN